MSIDASGERPLQIIRTPGAGKAAVPVTVVIPTIPPRGVDYPGSLLRRAVDSIAAQTVQPIEVCLALDLDRDGAAVTRQRALDMVPDDSEFVAFMDDDDTWHPGYLEALIGLARRTGASYLWSWFDGSDPFPTHRGRQMDLSDFPNRMHHTTMNVMVKTELAKTVGFRTDHPEGWDLPQEDWRFIVDCAAELIRRHGVEQAQAKFAHTPEILWTYRYHGRNTSGLPGRW